LALHARMATARLLVVDDEASVRELCARSLASAGCDVLTAPSGHDALVQLETECFDLVVTDLRMPGAICGTELAEQIKKRWPGTRVLLMTAFPALDSAVDTLRAGAMDYLIKPFDPAYLRDRVQLCLAAK
jgi:two-component system, response regulator FlrC